MFCNMCLPWAITNWVWEFYSFKNALGAHSLSQRPRHDLGTDGKIFLKFYEFFFTFWQVQFEKKRGGTRRPWSSNTIWHTYFLVFFGCGVCETHFLYFVSLSPKWLKNVFLQCRCYQGWFQYPSSWTTQIQWGNNWDPVFTFLSTVKKKEHLGSTFVKHVLALGYNQLSLGILFLQKMHWEPIRFHRDQGMTLALMGKYFRNSMSFFTFWQGQILKKKG